MKKLVTVCMGVAMALSITGCGDKVTLTEEQNDLIAEYVAGVMLKHSYENEWNYQKLNIAQNTYTSKGSMSNNKTAATTNANQQASTSSATNTTQSGLRPAFLHLMSINFSAPRSAPKPASVIT